MAAVLRVGLIGCGKMGLQHLRAISQVEGVRVVGIADPQADRTRLAGLLPQDAQVVGDATELLESIRPDVVHVVTPPQTHFKFAMQAIDAGCHVYVEKPFTPSKTEAAALLSHAAERAVKVCAGHQYLFERPSLDALRLLPKLGRLVYVESFFSFRTVRRGITAVDQAKDILPHAVYPLVAQLRAGTGLADAPITVTGMDVRVEGDVYALLRLGKSTGVLVVTLNGRPIEQYQHIVGTDGWIRADYVTGSVTHLSGSGTGPAILLTPYRRAFQTVVGATAGFSKLVFGQRTSYPGLHTLISRFYESIRRDGPDAIPQRSILDTVDVCEQIGAALDGALERAELAACTRLTAEASTNAASHRGRSDGARDRRNRPPWTACRR